MHIIAFGPNLAAQVTALYNEAVAPVPECYPVSEERFASVQSLAHGRVRDEEIAVAREDGEVVGFVHVGVALPAERGDEPKGEPGVIRFLSYRPGQRPVGRALLDWAERWAGERGRAEVLAWDCAFRYSFYHFPCSFLSEHIGHIKALFGMAGYGELGSEIYLIWPDFAPPEPGRPEVDFEVKMDWTEAPWGPRLEVRAMQGDQRIGICRMDRGQASPGPRAQDWCFCDWLNVEQAFQAKRLGHFLISTALAEMYKAGCRHAAISTSGNNYRAALMYTNLGYRVVDRTWCLRKELGA